MKRMLALLMAVLTVFSLSACGSSAKSDAAYMTGAAYPEYAAATSNGYSDYAVAEEAYEYESSENGLASEETAYLSEGKTDAGDINTEKIIYSADVTLETTTFEDTLKGLEEMVERYGGFVESSSVSGSTYYGKSSGSAGTRYASYTIRVPGEDFNTVMSTLACLGNVPYSYTYTENVTAEYYDTRSRLEAYQAQEDSLIAMMEKAETVEDLITIENALVEVRYKIDSLQSSLTNLDRKVSYSTINLSIEEVREYTPEATESYGHKLVRAMKDGFVSVGNFFSDFLLFLLEALPTIVILALLVFAAVKIVKKCRKIRKERKSAAKAALTETEAQDKTE